MKSTFLVFLAMGALLLSVPVGMAQNTNDAAAELSALVSKVRAKMEKGATTASSLAPEIKEFDALLEKHKGEKTDSVAQILLMKTSLYEEVLKDTAKANSLKEQLKRDFPDSKAARMLKLQEEAEKTSAALAIGTRFPDFTEKDLAGNPLSVAQYKGKVVLVDFWATWCGPCVHELPNVLKAYEAHHAKGFEIIGISLDGDKQKLQDFIKDRNMPWPQYFDGRGWQCKLAEKYGVRSIPATYLLDGQGVIIGKNLRGEELERAVAKALAGK